MCKNNNKKSPTLQKHKLSGSNFFLKPRKLNIIQKIAYTNHENFRMKKPR